MNPTDRHSAVESLAYDLWTARGQPLGSPEVDWCEAERLVELRYGSSDQTTILSDSLSKSSAGSDGAFDREEDFEQKASSSIFAPDEDSDRAPSSLVVGSKPPIR